MELLKQVVPILEFDEGRQAFIEPRIKSEVKLPRKAVICFFRDAIEQLVMEDQLYEITRLSAEDGDLIVYKYHDSDCLVVPGRLGAPASAGFFEELIALGITQFMFCGGGGVLRQDMTLGRLVVIDSAIRDEGTSYHYLKPAREVQANQVVLNHITNYLDTNKINYLKGKAWTTDAFYRETPAKIALRKEEGAVIVEMEQAALLAVAEFRHVQYGAIIYGGDDLSGETWDSRKWSTRSDIRVSLLALCKDIVIEMK
jgi:uridine phosphorylase